MEDKKGLKDVKVLLVDDDRSIRNLLRIALSVEEGVGEVREATDGSDALRVLDDFKPDVILLDYWMPRMDGARVAPLIREKHPDVRIVAFSGVLEERPIWADAFYTKGSLPDLGEILLGA
ncbi:MAG: response regulator [Actinobacteria bacterium]|nr:response regulator [Actinomycetota bacterium]